MYRAFHGLIGCALLALFGCSDSGERILQGYVDGDFRFMSPDDPGRVAALEVEEGDSVEEGQLLFSVDDTLEISAFREARANMERANAQKALIDDSRQSPEEIDVLKSDHAVAQAAFTLAQIELVRQRTLVNQKAVPQSRLDSAQASFDRDKSTLEEAARRIRVATLPQRPQERDSAEQSLLAAIAQESAATERLERRRVRAPKSGSVERVYLRVGEIASANNPVISFLPTDARKIRFFIPEPMRPKISVGQTVTIRCDGCSGPVEARIYFIAPRVEYTPPVIYSLDERSKLVFLAEAIPVQGPLLNVGQPVSVHVKI